MKWFRDLSDWWHLAAKPETKAAISTAIGVAAFIATITLVLLNILFLPLMVGVGVVCLLVYVIYRAFLEHYKQYKVNRLRADLRIRNLHSRS